MLGSLVIVFREVLEAGLIVGIVLAATEGVAGRGRFVAGGIAAGLAGAGLLAVFTGGLSGALGGNGQEVFNATILLLATLMLGWHVLWMSRHGRETAMRMKAMGREVAAGDRSLLAMAVVVAVAVLREGAEVVLFLFGIAAGSHTGALPLLAGGLLGVAGGAAVSYALYRGLTAIPLHRLFSVTGVLVSLLAAGMAGQAAAILAGAGLIPAWGWQVWDTSWLLPDGSLPGQALHALVGYSDRPLGVQILAYALTLAVLLLGGRLLQPRRHGAPAAAH